MKQVSNLSEKWLKVDWLGTMYPDPLANQAAASRRGFHYDCEELLRGFVEPYVTTLPIQLNVHRGSLGPIPIEDGSFIFLIRSNPPCGYSVPFHALPLISYKEVIRYGNLS